MLITDLLEDIHRFGQTEIEFHLVDKDGKTKKLELYITLGQYLYKNKDVHGKDTDIIVLGLTEEKNA